MAETPSLIYLARHGETAWTMENRHTGRTDLPLSERGEHNARRLGERLMDLNFAQVLVSPLQRARRTRELAGFGLLARVAPDLREWDYGAYEGRRTAEIHEERPGWCLFRDGCPGGESVDGVGARADQVVARLRSAEGNVLIFSHSHFLRVLAARWLELAAREGRHFFLSTASLSILGYEHGREDPVICLWDDDRHVGP